MAEDAPHPHDPLTDAVLRGPGPAPARLAKVARPYVDRARLKLKDFRVDLEAIQSAVVDASKDGVVDTEEAKLIFLDIGDVVSLPLVQRYLDASEFALVARYLKHRIMYHPTDWLSERNRLALDGMIAGCESAMAVALLSEFLKKLHNHTREQWRAASRKAPKSVTNEATLASYEAAREKALRDLPAHLEIAELQMAEIDVYLTAHGSREDRRALEKFREEITKVRKRFKLAE